MERCPNCGVETRPGDQFCLNCGNRLTGGSQPASNQNQWGPPPGPAAPPFNQWGPPPGAQPAQNNPWPATPPNPPTTPTMPTVQAPFGMDSGGTTVANTAGGTEAPTQISEQETLEPTVRAPEVQEPAAAAARPTGPTMATVAAGDYLGTVAANNSLEARVEGEGEAGEAT